MRKYAKKILNSKKIAAIFLEYILAIECLLLIFLLLRDNIDTNTAIDENGIRWSYSIQDGYVQNVCYHSGILKEVVVIPETINGCKVVSIKPENNSLNIFNSYQNKIVKHIVLPNTIKNIGEGSFRNCISLESIEIPDTVTEVEKSVFEGCTKLTNVIMSNNITKIASGTFNMCSNLIEINIPKGVTNIEKEAFQNCMVLEEINMPEGLQSIGDNAFSNCYKLRDLVFPDTLQTLGEGAFSYCRSLKDISIPQQIKRIGYNTFISCANLTNVNMGNNLEVIGNDAFNGCINLREITIPDSVTTMGMQSFANCNNLKNITLPKDIIAIERATFYNCNNLESVHIGSKVKKIGVQAFSGCENLSNVNIPTIVNEIGEYAFFGCSSLEKLAIDKNNENYIIEDGIIYTKDKKEIVSIVSNNLTEITLPDTVEKIRVGAFRGNTYLKKIYLKQNIKNIESFAFADCSQLTDIYIENEKEKVVFNSGWDYNTNAFVHDKNCIHEVEQVSQNGDETINTITKVKCGDNHTFKVAGSTKNMKVRVISQGDFNNSNKTSSVILPDKNGLYTIENIDRNKKVLLQNKNASGGVIVRYLDIDGNDISDEEYIEGEIGEEYNTKPKIISGYGRIKDDKIIQNGILGDELITISYKYQKIERDTINLFQNQYIGVYIIIFLLTILINLIIYVIVDRKK